MSKERLKTIIEKILDGTATTDEVAEISDALQQDHANEMVEDIHAFITRPEEAPYATDEKKWDLISSKILGVDKINQDQQPSGKVRRLITKLAVAATVIVAVATTVYLLRSDDQQPIIAKTPAIINNQDVSAPGRVNAVLSLSSGQQIELNTAGTGALSMEGNTEVVKLANGEIVYKTRSGTPGHETSYNTLTVPRGSQLINVTLADGTKAWLNNESSLRYPTAFTGNERIVEITGEAYFEVAKDATKPFFVKCGETNIRVLGTHFNVNAYAEAASIKVTLLEGSVNVSKGSSALTLKPGQQAEVNDRMKLSAGYNVEEVMAWKNGKFAFYDADIKTVMDQVARWYNLDIEYKAKTSERFHVELTRNTNVSNVLKILEGTGAVHFKFERNKLVVMP